MIPIQVCSVNFGSKLIIAIINGIVTTSILIIQNDEQVLLTKEVLSYEQAFQLQNVDTLTIGSKDNTNINSFRLSNIRISNGFYYVIKEECAFSINQCFYCLNVLKFQIQNNYLHQGQCLLECPSNFETNEFRKECIPKCHPTCLTCDPFNLSYCLTCSGIRIKEPNCSCPPGYFDDGISPDCIEYLPDLTVESGIFEGTCQSNIQQEIKFTKKYLFPPLVAISLLGHIAKEQYQNQGLIFTISAQDITNISFFLTVICMDPKVYIKVQWVSGYSSRFFNVNNNLIGVFPVDVFDVSIQKENLVIGNILGWNIDEFDQQDINLNLEKKSDTNTFEFTTNLSLVQIFYQLFEFTNYVYDQILISLDLCTQGKDFSIGGAHWNVNIKHVPLSIPSFTTLKQFNNQNSHILQFYLSENKRTGQMKYSLKTLGQQTTFPYLKGDIVIFAIKCNNHYKPCDYVEELQKCHKILSNCECSSSQYYNSVKNYCVDCSYNCQTCDIHYTNCLTCPSEYQQTLLQDQVTLYYYCGCKQNQFQDSDGICQDCDPMCLSCEQTKTKCKSCIEPKILNEQNQCICNPGYIVTQFGCEQSILDLCSFFKDDNQCEQCVPLSQFNPITKKCECNFGYYQEDQQCLACNEPCLSCLSNTSCLSCVATMYFDQFSCHECQQPCYECNSETSCISCINQTYILDGDQCLLRDYSIQQDCEEGFELLNNQCVSICGDKLVTNKEECDDGNNIQFDGCHLCQYSCTQNCTDCYQGNCQECENNFILLTNGQCESNQICGDGIQMDPEFCDDANTIGGDGCNNCFIESNWKCNELNECTFFKAPQLILIYQNQTFNKQYVSITFTQKVKIQIKKFIFLSIFQNLKLINCLIIDLF
ncbi:unnamed protein product [Paramecium primaurelia]|uniref:EGF-like domain-containing protein n=1 Tax=Paramecium primaurelia TaxID=5886 RepID=A0A8S1NQF7_PARPR|nr:unnamed protein product [Paramecium primaurelia]